MTPRIIGPDLFAKNDQGRPLSRIATVFPHDNVIVTLPTVHFFQQDAYLDLLDQERQTNGVAPMTAEQREARRKEAVSLFVDDGTVQIRPDPDDMPLVFAADAVLQTLLAKSRIRFLNALEPKVRAAVKRRGECWRITPLPKHTCEMKQMIRASRTAIEGRDIYYYSKSTGARWLTCQEFAQLAALDDDDLRKHLVEIQKYCDCRNGQGNHEVDFFLADRSFRASMKALDLSRLDAVALRAAHHSLQKAFASVVRPDLRRDDVKYAEWRRQMYAALVPHGDDVASEEELLGLGRRILHAGRMVAGRPNRGRRVDSGADPRKRADLRRGGLDDARTQPGEKPALRPGARIRRFGIRQCRPCRPVDGPPAVSRRTSQRVRR